FKLPHGLICRIIFIQNVEEKIGADLMIVLLLQCLVDRRHQRHMRQGLLSEELFRVQNIRLGKFSADVCNQQLPLVNVRKSQKHRSVNDREQVVHIKV